MNGMVWLASGKLHSIEAAVVVGNSWHHVHPPVADQDGVGVGVDVGDDVVAAAAG